MTWQPVKDYIEKYESKTYRRRTNLFPRIRARSIRKYNKYAVYNYYIYEKQGHKQLYQILIIIIDDFADHEKMQAFKITKSMIH